MFFLLTTPILSQSPENLNILKYNIQLAEISVTENTLLSRLIPKINLSASFGANKIFFFDEYSYSLPYPYSDHYGISLSLNLNRILDFASLDKAQLQLKIAQEKYMSELKLLKQKIKSFETEQDLICEQIEYVKQEISVLLDLYNLAEQKFQNGEIDYDSFIKSSLDLIDSRKNLSQLEIKLADVTSRIAQLSLYNLEESF